MTRKIVRGIQELLPRIGDQFIDYHGRSLEVVGTKIVSTEMGVKVTVMMHDINFDNEDDTDEDELEYNSHRRTEH